MASTILTFQSDIYTISPGEQKARQQMAVILNGQVALVTGAGRGIGRATAEALAAAGASVVIAARSAGQLAETAESIAAAGGAVMSRTVDVRDSEAIQDLVLETASRFGPISLLVNNAGTAGPAGNDWEVDAQAWWECIEVCVRGAFLCTQAVLPGMIALGGGRVIEMASLTGTRAYPPITATSVSKTALIRMSEGLAATAGPLGISAFAIHPGIVKTELLLSYGMNIPESAYVPAALAAEMCVRLASGKYDALSGRFLTVNDDLDALVRDLRASSDSDKLTLRIQA